MHPASRGRPWVAYAPIAAGILAPAALTAVLLPFVAGQSRDYTFLYVALVAALGVTLGLLPALAAAAASFLLVDWFFVPPLHTLTIADSTDVLNLLVFFGAAGFIGTLGSRRRTAELRAQALAERFRDANLGLEQRNREQAQSAAMAVNLARAQQQVRVLEETDRVRRDFLANVSHGWRATVPASPGCATRR